MLNLKGRTPLNPYCSREGSFEVNLMPDAMQLISIQQLLLCLNATALLLSLNILVLQVNIALRFNKEMHEISMG